MNRQSTCPAEHDHEFVPFGMSCAQCGWKWSVEIEKRKFIRFMESTGLLDEEEDYSEYEDYHGG